MAEAEAATPVVSYEDLALIEDEFEEIDSEIIKQQYNLSKPAYAKRAEAIGKIPNFWPLVLEQAPLEIDGYVQTSDSRIFAESLESISVRRFELDDNASAGSPRSLSIAFTFKPNDDFDDTVLEKKLWYRRASDGWTGLVSEPVRIRWKAGRDPTEGLTDAAAALWDARVKAGDMRAGDALPAYAALKEKVEHWNGANTSFFTWFGWVSGRRWVSAEESAKANAEHAAKREARKRGEKVEDGAEEAEEDEDADAKNDDSDVEVHETGEDLAISIAEDLWPNAIKFFTQAQEFEEMSDADFEDDEDMDEVDDDDDVPVDIRALVEERNAGAKGKRVSDVAPPAKKQKK